jgi:hypothetical protein
VLLAAVIAPSVGVAIGALVPALIWTLLGGAILGMLVAPHSVGASGPKTS